MAEIKEDLTKLTVKELQAMAIKLGMPAEDASTFEVKKPLIATINALRAKEVVNESVAKEEIKKDKEKWTSKKERMRAILLKQKKVRVLVPLEGKEEVGEVKWIFNEKSKRKEQVYIKGSYIPVQINGFKWIVPKGVYVDVPEQVSDIISNAQQATAESGKDFLIDRRDPETGQEVRNMLE